MNKNLGEIQAASALVIFAMASSIVLIIVGTEGAPSGGIAVFNAVILAIAIHIFWLSGKQIQLNAERAKASEDERKREDDERQKTNVIRKIVDRWHQLQNGTSMQNRVKVHHIEPSKRGDGTIVCCCMIGEPQEDGQLFYEGIVAEVNLSDAFVTRAIAVKEGFISFCDSTLSRPFTCNEPLLDLVATRHPAQVLYEFRDIPAHDQNPLVSVRSHYS